MWRTHGRGVEAIINEASINEPALEPAGSLTNLSGDVLNTGSCAATTAIWEPAPSTEGTMDTLETGNSPQAETLTVTLPNSTTLCGLCRGNHTHHPGWEVGCWVEGPSQTCDPARIASAPTGVTTAATPPVAGTTPAGAGTGTEPAGTWT